MAYAVPSFSQGEPTTTVIPSSQQKLGIEIEVENVRHLELDGLPAKKYWGVTGDGSLRNGGVEFVSKVLLAEEADPALQAFYSLWKTKNMHTNIRCGIHVHMNCLNLMIPDLAGIFTTYALLEPFLMSYCGDLREENIYCVPWYRSTVEADKAAVLVKDPKERFMVLRQAVSHACKYAALNFGPLQRFGTLEFRHAPTWEDIGPTTTWVNMLLRLMEYGAKRDPKEILDAWHKDPELWYRLVLSKWCPSVLRSHVLRAEEVGAVSVAEKFLPVSKLKARDWVSPTLHVQGGGADRYAENRPPEIEMRGVHIPRPPRTPRTRTVTLTRPVPTDVQAAEFRVFGGTTMTWVGGNLVDTPTQEQPEMPTYQTAATTVVSEGAVARRERIDRLLREMQANVDRVTNRR